MFFFTEKTLNAVKRSGTALIRTTDLFKIAQYLSGTDDKRYATKCRKAIFETSGDIVVFPEPPEQLSEKIEIRTPEEQV